MKKKILIFSLVYYPFKVGGAEGAIKDITDRLNVEDYDFHLLCNRYDSNLTASEKIGNVTVHRIGLARAGTKTEDLFHPFFYLVKILYIPLATLKAFSLHRKIHFDAFWSMMLYMTYPVVLLRFLGVKKPYVVTLQEGDTFEHVFGRWYIRLFEPLLVYGIRKASKAQVISNFLGQWAKQKGFQGEPVLIPNAVNAAHFTQLYKDEELRAVRLEFGLSDKDVLLVTTSRLVNKNAVDDVIRAIAILPKQVKFVVFGNGPDENKLRVLAEELGVEDRVLFRGHIGHDVMPKYLKACDIFIRPSRSEGMGNSFVEAMAAELPVIATQEGGIADFLFDEKRNPEQGTTGWATDVNSPEQIKVAVEDILNHPDKVQAVLQRAKAMAIEKYNWDLIADRMNKEIFQPLVNEQMND